MTKQTSKKRTKISKKQLALFLLTATLVFTFIESINLGYVTLLSGFLSVSIGICSALVVLLITYRYRNKEALSQADQHHTSLKSRIKTIDKNIATLTKKVNSPSTTQTLPQSFNLPFDLSIISSVNSSESYVLSNDIFSNRFTMHHRHIFNKVVTQLKKNGQHIRVLKSFNKPLSVPGPPQDTESAIDFPLNLINYN